MALVLTIGLKLGILMVLGAPAARWVVVLLTALYITGSTKGITELIKVHAHKKTEV